MLEFLRGVQISKTSKTANTSNLFEFVIKDYKVFVKGTSHAFYIGHRTYFVGSDKKDAIWAIPKFYLYASFLFCKIHLCPFLISVLKISITHLKRFFLKDSFKEKGIRNHQLAQMNKNYKVFHGQLSFVKMIFFIIKVMKSFF